MNKTELDNLIKKGLVFKSIGGTASIHDVPNELINPDWIITTVDVNYSDGTNALVSYTDVVGEYSSISVFFKDPVHDKPTT